MDEKRPITPHKGGRNAAFPHSRLSVEERMKLDQILAHMGISAADWVAPKIHDDYRLIFGDEPQSAVQENKMSWLTDLLARKTAAREAQEAFWEQNKATPEQIAEIEACPPMRQEAAEEHDLSPRKLTKGVAETIIRKWRR